MCHFPDRHFEIHLWELEESVGRYISLCPLLLGDALHLCALPPLEETWHS